MKTNQLLRTLVLMLLMATTESKRNLQQREREDINTDNTTATNDNNKKNNNETKNNNNDTNDNNNNNESIKMVSKEIKTSMSMKPESSNNDKAYGLMFDVVSHRDDVTITGISLQNLQAETTIEVWSISGSYTHYTLLPQRWKLLTTRNTTSFVKLNDQGIKIKKEETLAFYITTYRPELSYLISLEQDSGQVYVNNNDLDILVGSSIDYPFGTSKNNRVLNGILHYQILSQSQESTNSLSTSFFDSHLEDDTNTDPNQQQQVSFGIIFDIKAWVDLTIYSIDLHLQDSFLATTENDASSTDTTLELIQIFVLNEKNTQEICNTNQRNQGLAGITSVQTITPISLGAGEQRTIKILLSRKKLLSSQSNTNNNFVNSNDELMILKGYTLNRNGASKNDSSLVNFHGIIRYSFSQACQNLKQVSILSNSIAQPKPTQHYGIMFYIISSKAISLEAIQLSTTELVDYSVWTRTGSFINLENFQYNDWELLISKSTISVSSQQKTLTDPMYFKSFPLKPNDPQAIYIRVESKEALLLMTGEEPKNGIVASDSVLDVYEGRLVSEIGNILMSPVNFTGNVYYSIIKDDCSNQHATTLTPTSSPIEITNSPTLLSPDDSDVKSKSPFNSKISKTSAPTSFMTVLAEENTTPQPIVSPTINPTISKVIPTPIPTLQKNEITYVEYMFSVLDDETQAISQILDKIDAAIYAKINFLLVDETNFHYYSYSSNADVQLVSVSSSLSAKEDAASNCVETFDTYCYIIESKLEISYKSQVTSASHIRFIFLSLGMEAANVLPFSFGEYIGYRSVSSIPIVTLDGLNDAEFKNNNNTVSFYETSVKDFINEYLFLHGTADITITDVSTSSNTLVYNINRRRRNRVLSYRESSGNSSSSSSTSCSISTSVLGEYLPPPEVILDELVQDSLNSYGDALVKKLKKNPTFVKVDSISAAFVAPTNSPTPTPTFISSDHHSYEKNDGQLNDKIKIIIISISVVFFIVCGILTCSCRKVKKNEEKRLSNGSPNVFDNRAPPRNATRRGSLDSLISQDTFQSEVTYNRNMYRNFFR